MNSEKDNTTMKISTETNPSTNSSSTDKSHKASGSKCPMISSGDKSMGLMGSQEGMQIPTKDLSGIENFDEAMQIYFRDAYNLCKIFSVTMALKMQIFEIINTSTSYGMTLDEIYSKLPLGKVSGFTDRHLRDLLCELGSQGYLQSEGGIDSHIFRLTDMSKKSFLISSPNSVVRLYMNLNRYMNCFQEITVNNFAFNSKPQNPSQDNLTNENETGMIIDYFYATSKPCFERMMDMVDFSRFKRVMDVRGSYGLLSSMLKKKFPTLSCISYDNPSMKTHATEKISQLGMQNEISVESGNLLTGQLPEADCVIAPFIFMHYNDENCLKIMKHIFTSVNSSKGGQLIILENLLDTDWKDCKALSMSYMMAIQNSEGNARTFKEFKVMLMSAGFKNVDRMQMGPGMADMMIALK